MWNKKTGPSDSTPSRGRVLCTLGMAILGLMFLCQSASAQAPVTQLIIMGDPGEGITMGKSYNFTPRDGAFGVSASAIPPNTSPNDISVFFTSTDGSQRWQLEFFTQASQGLTMGLYSNEGQGVAGGVQVDGNGFGCGSENESFTIINAQYGFSGGQYQLNSFAAQFEQQCDGQTPALRGMLYYNYTPPVVPTILTYTTPPNAEVGIPYSFSFLSVGGTSPVTWSVTSGQLPPGLILSPGQLAGTPTLAGNYTFSVSLTDSAGHQSQTPFAIMVAPQTTEPPVTELVVAGCQGCVPLPGTQSFTPSTGMFMPLVIGPGGIQMSFQANPITAGITSQWWYSRPPTS
jgi:hypothetical protein